MLPLRDNFIHNQFSASQGLIYYDVIFHGAVP